MATREEKLARLQALEAEQAAFEASQGQQVAAAPEPLEDKAARLEVLELEQENFELKQEEEDEEIDKEREDDKQKGIMQKGLDTLMWVGEAADRLTGASTARSALGRAVGLDRDKDREADEFEFAPATEDAPTGKEIAEGLGISGEPFSVPTKTVKTAEGIQVVEKPLDEQTTLEKLSPSPAGVVGLGIEIGADPAGIIPVGKIAKGLASIGIKGLKWMGKGSALASDLATGTKAATKTAKTAGGLTKSIGEAIEAMSRPKISTKFPEFKLIAEKNGIDLKLLPSGPEFGRESLISKAERAQAAVGGPKLERYEKGIQAVNNAIDGKISTIGKGAPMDELEAGNFLVDAWNKEVDKILNVDETYAQIAKGTAGKEIPGVIGKGDDIVEKIGGLTIDEKSRKALDSSLGEFEKFANRKLRFGEEIQQAQAKALLGSIERAKLAGDNFEDVVEVMQNIGKNAFSKGNKSLTIIPAEQKKLQELYFNLSEAVTKTVDSKLGADVGAALRENNKRIKEYLGHESAIGKLLDETVKGPETIFKSVLLSGDSRKIGALKAITSVEDFQKLKGSMFDSLIKRNPDGDILYRSTRSNLKRRKSALRALTNDPQELVDLEELLRLGDEIGGPVSTSGTGAAISLKGLGKTILVSATDDQIIEFLKNNARSRAQAEKLLLESGVKQSKMKRVLKRLPVGKWGKEQIAGKAVKTGAQQKESLRRQGIELPNIGIQGLFKEKE